MTVLYFMRCDKPSIEIRGITYANPPVNMSLCATFFANTETDKGDTLYIIRFISAYNHRIATWRFASAEDRDAQLQALDKRLCSRV